MKLQYISNIGEVPYNLSETVLEQK